MGESLLGKDFPSPLFQGNISGVWSCRMNLRVLLLLVLKFPWIWFLLDLSLT